MSKPCEYCGVDLPLGVDKGTRRVRSFHFASCENRPKTTPPSMDIEAQRDALLGLLKEARKIVRASSSRNLVKDWDQRTTDAIKAVEEA